MSVHFKHSLIAWLLPLIVLRTFVPTGFMLTWAGNELQMVLCSGAGPAAVQAAASSDHRAQDQHAHHPHGATQAGGHAQHDHDGSQVQEGSYCPFAVASSANAPTVDYLLEAYPPHGEIFDVIALPKLRSAVLPIDRIRGPPHA